MYSELYIMYSRCSRFDQVRLIKQDIEMQLRRANTFRLNHNYRVAELPVVLLLIDIVVASFATNKGRQLNAVLMFSLQLYICICEFICICVRSVSVSVFVFMPKVTNSCVYVRPLVVISRLNYRRPQVYHIYGTHCAYIMNVQPPRGNRRRGN